MGFRVLGFGFRVSGFGKEFRRVPVLRQMILRGYGSTTTPRDRETEFQRARPFFFSLFFWLASRGASGLSGFRVRGWGQRGSCSQGLETLNPKP